MDLFQSNKMNSLPSAPIPNNMIQQTILPSSSPHFQPSIVLLLVKKFVTGFQNPQSVY